MKIPKTKLGGRS
ncbi:Protein of unknown function [Lactobacillus acidophilus CIRM-BIA 442]|nr:Protein of unknown function [Lactobacillus acidophilus CIRM-BIA 442]